MGRKVRAACRTIGAMPRNSSIKADELLKTVGAEQSKSQKAAVSPGETIVSELQGSVSSGTLQQLATVKKSQSDSTLQNKNNVQNIAGSGTLASTGETMPEDWTLINRYQAKLNEDQKLVERAAKLEKRRKIQEELEAQIKLKEQQKQRASTGDDKYVKYLAEQKKKWAEED